jgi:2-polyprenyl-6-hydroxyphenyl methylase/3-demethylubiquinone-9 3-methyltransferase
MPRRPVRPRNHPAQYEDLVDEWWRPYGRFAGLHSLAQARAGLVPPCPRPGALLLDVGCGAGLLGPVLRRRAPGWRHVGVDLSRVSLRLAAQHGTTPVVGDALRLPFDAGAFDCVVAGEMLEHLPDVEGACAELARVLRPGGTLVIDTIADSWFARLAVIKVAERLPGGPPPRVHDPGLLVDPERLRNALLGNGIRPGPARGVRPSARDYLAWLARRRPVVRMVPTRSTAGVYQVVAVKPAA